MSEDGEKGEKTGWPWWLIAFVLICGIAVVVYGRMMIVLWYPSLGTWEGGTPTGNEAGDALGPLASLFSALALMAALITVHMQRKELALQRDEMQATRAEMAEQTKLLERQGLAADAQAQAARAQASAAEATSFHQFQLTYHEMIGEVYQLRSGLQMRHLVSSWTLPQLPLCRHRQLMRLAIAVQSAAMECFACCAPPIRSDQDEDTDLLLEVLTTLKRRLDAFHTGVRIWYPASLAGRDLSTLEGELMKELLDDSGATSHHAMITVNDLLTQEAAFDIESGEPID